MTAILDKDGQPEKLLAVSRDVTELKQSGTVTSTIPRALGAAGRGPHARSGQTSTVLQEIVEGVESKIGEQFFPSLVQQLTTALGVDYAYMSELSEDGTTFRSRAGWGKGRPLPSV